MSYPCVEIDLGRIRANAEAMTRFCAERGISVTGVVKAAYDSPDVARAFYDGGCTSVGGSRVKQLQLIKEASPDVSTMQLRLPMLSEAEETVRWCDVSLNSSLAVLKALNAAAARQKVTHGVLLLIDVGDLREGVPDKRTLTKLAATVEGELRQLRLVGVGSTFGCFGSILPDRHNLGELVDAAERVEQAIGRRLELISGGSSISLVPLLAGEMPERVNHLRIGGAIINPIGIRLNRGVSVPGLSEDTCLLRAEIIEVFRKPSKPYGQRSLNWTGNAVEFEDIGLRRRAVAAVGCADIGDPTKLIPSDGRIRVLGASSDHLILDVEDCGDALTVGDAVSFRMFYTPLMYAFATKDISIRFI